MSLETVGGILAPILVFLAAIIGLAMKRRSEKQAAEDAKLKEKADREEAARLEKDRIATQQAKDLVDQLQESLRAAQDEMRAMKNDMNDARLEISRLWTQITELRRENDALEMHNTDMHRWDDSGRVGPMPARPINGNQK